MATIMSVVDEGKLTLDDKVTQFYPDVFTDDAENMKLIDMMAHMSGYDLADEWVYGEDKISLQDSVLGIATGETLNGEELYPASINYFPPGT